MTTVIVAHGAWTDGSTWGEVIDALHTAGIPAVAAPLPLTSLPDDVAALNRVIEQAADAAARRDLPALTISSAPAWRN